MRFPWSLTPSSSPKSQNKVQACVTAQRMTSAETGKLDLSGRQLTAVPPDVWRNNSLRVLNLFRNELTCLPASIAHLRELRVLIVANNQLRALPDELGMLRRLRMLDAGHNLIADLPRSFGKLASIADYLYLHDNRLRVLSDSIFENFLHLRYLNLSENPLRGLPASVARSSNWKSCGSKISAWKRCPASSQISLRSTNWRCATTAWPRSPIHSRTFASYATSISAETDSRVFPRFCEPSASSTNSICAGTIFSEFPHG